MSEIGFKPLSVRNDMSSNGTAREERSLQAFRLSQGTRGFLYPRAEQLFEKLYKAMSPERLSSTPRSSGEKAHPFDFDAVNEFLTMNTYHGSCVRTKRDCTVGKGFRSPEEIVKLEAGEQPNERDRRKMSKAEKILGPLCDFSFQALLNETGEDYWNAGNGWMEVVRRGAGDRITGLHHSMPREVWVLVEDEGEDFHYVIRSVEGGAGGERHFARFGDKDDLVRRMKLDPNEVSELIHFAQPTSLSRYYGYPDWLAAVSPIEIQQKSYQYVYDFFDNGAVPDYLLFLLGASIKEKDWKRVEAMMKQTAGVGNSHRSAAFNFSNTDLTVQLERLAMEGREIGAEYQQLVDTNAMQIVSAHRVPPLLAGILIPGKLGASNEFPNALTAFQALVISSAQQNFQMTLAATLGDPAKNGGLGLTEDDFELRTVVDELDMSKLATVGGMRQPLPEAQAEGRDLGAGLKE